MPYDVTIIGRSNGVGLDRDAKLLIDALGNFGVSATFAHVRSLPGWSRLLPVAKHRSEAAIFLERLAPQWYRHFRKRFLIPNQERYPKRHLTRLKGIDQVLAKSHHAADVFGQFCDCHYIGFTSEDRRLAAIKPDYSRFFHLAGRSTLKGSEDVLRIWKQHPEWPELVYIQHPDNAPTIVPKNVRLIKKYLSDEELRQLQNECGVHICPSRSEGWGHYIYEAMSCQAVVVTTDAPPMNELLTQDVAKLVSVQHSEPRHLGTNFFVDVEHLEAAISRLIRQSDDEKREIGHAARELFARNHLNFLETSGKLADSLLSGIQSKAAA